MNILQLLSQVPNVIWSGVIASVLTLSGVLISNRSNTKRLLIQLRHDGEEKTKERTSSMRREIYLKAAEEVVRLNAYLMSLPQKDLAKGNLGDGFIDFQTISARLQLVAEPKTTLLAMRLSAAYGELALELTMRLMPVGKAKIDIGISDDFYQKAQQEVQRVLSSMVAQNESESPSPQIFEKLQRSFTSHQEQAQKYANERNAAWGAFNRENLIFSRYLFTKLRDLSVDQLALITAIRHDLALPGDLSEVEAEYRIQSERMEHKFEEFLSFIELQLKNPLE